jgi:hypothetical protein
VDKAGTQYARPGASSTSVPGNRIASALRPFAGNIAQELRNAEKEKRRNLQHLKEAARESFPQIPSVDLHGFEENESARICENLWF